MEIKGLKMSQEDREGLLRANPQLSSLSDDQLNRVYRNSQYVDFFGESSFYNTPEAVRNKMVEDALVRKAFSERYKDDLSDFSEEGDAIISTEAMQYLLENDYATQNTRENIYQHNIPRKALTTVFGAPLQEMGESVTRGLFEKYYNRILDNARQIDKNVLLNREDVTALERSNKDALLRMVDEGRGQEISEAFDNLLNKRQPLTNSPIFPYYTAYKDSYQMQDLSIYDQVDMLSKFYALQQTASNSLTEEEGNAIFSKSIGILNDDVRHKIYEDTYLADKWLKEQKMIATKFYSNIGLTPLGIYALAMGLYEDDKTVNNFLMGKDKDGNDLPWYFNLQYFSDVDKYNSFSVADIKLAKENGGISESALLRDVGEDYKLFTTETFLESGAMLGYVAASIGIDYFLTDGVGAAAKATGKQALKQALKAGVNPRNLVKMRRLVDNSATDLMSDIARLNIHSIGESTMEAATTAQDVYYGVLENLESPEEQQKLKEIVNRRVQEQLEKEFPNNSDVFVRSKDGSGVVSKRMLREEELRAEYTNEYVEDIAVNSAAAAYKTQFASMQLKNTLIDATCKTYMFARPFSTKIRASEYLDPKKTIFKNGAFESKHFTWKDGILNASKTVAGGGIEELTDNMAHSGSENVGLNYSNNYLQQLYNGDSIASTGIVASAALAYINGAGEAIFDDGTLLETCIGAFSPIGNVAVRPSALKYVKPSNRKKLSQGSFLENMNAYIYNPLLVSIMEERQSFDNNKRIAEQVNNVLKEHGDDFKTISSSINAIKAFNEIRTSGTVVDAKDSKFALAFNFISNLRTLAATEKASRLVSDYNRMLTEASNGNISDDMVAEYFAQPENKNLINEKGKDVATEEAKQQIQKNAKELLKLFDEYNSTYSTISNFSKGALDEEGIQQLTFQSLLSKNWQSRMQDMESVLTGKTSVSSDRRLGQMHDKGREEIVNEFNERAHALNLFSNGKKLNGVLGTIMKSYRKLANAYKEADNSLLTATEIIGLAPEYRQRMLEHPGLYTAEQIEEIEKAENILAQKDPDYRAKVRDIATLHQRIEQNNESYKMLLDNPEQLQQYKMNLAVQARIDAVANTRKAFIDNMLRGFDAAELDNNAVIEKAKRLNSDALKTLISARPQYTELLSPYVDRAATIENLSNTVDALEVSDNQKNVLKNSLAVLVENTSTAQEVIDAIEDFIETTGDGKEETLVLREQMNEILNAAKDFNIVRDASKAYSNQAKLEKDRKIRAAKDRKNAKARAKTEEKRQARIAAEKARKAKEAEEKRLRQEAEAKAKGETMKGGKMEDTTKPGEVTVSNEETLDLGIEYDKNTSEVQTPTEEPTETPIETETPAEPNNELPPTDSNSEATQLRGNTLTPYSTKDLEEGTLTSREETTTGWLKDFFDWMKNAGIKFQDIVDFELGEIAKLNPTVHYMMAVTDKNATNDAVLSKTPLLVVEATDAIKKIHDESRGGIIKANGKEWLVIGMMGYAPNSNEQTTWQNTLNTLSANRDAYFKSNPTERFEVDSRLTTSIKEISNGRLIKQLPKDSEYQYRSISELLADAERNPYGLTWKDLSFAIQMATGGFELSRTLDGTIYTPSRTEENAGNVFIMVKATNGNYFPVAIRPTFLSEIRPGALQDMIDSLLQDVLNPDHKVRLTAVSRLKFLLNLNDEDNILVGKEGLNVVSIKQNGVVVDKFNLDAENFDRAQAFKKLKSSRFRIQISKNNLQDIERLKQLDEAGALTTDAAMLATAGAGYTIYATDLGTGKPIDYEPISSSENATVRGSGLYRSQEPTQMLDGKRVTFHNGQWVDDSGKVITDAEALNKIKALNYLEEHKIPVAYKSKSGYNVYIVSESQDNPVVVMVNGSHNVNIYNGADAQRAIDFHNQQQRDKAAKNANMEEIELNLTEKPKEVTISTPSTPVVVSEKVTTSKEKTKEKETFSEVEGKKSVKDLQDSKNLLTFANIITNKSFGNYVIDSLEQIFKEKGWGEMPDSYEEVENILNNKGVPMPSEMSQTQIDNWLKLIKECIK